MSADRHAEIMAILHQMQAAAQPGEQVTNIRKVKSYIAHLSGRISELESGPGVKLVHQAPIQRVDYSGSHGRCWKKK